MAKNDKTLSVLLESSLENITNRASQPVEILGKEKHVDDLSRDLRELDSKLQQANWMTDLK